MRVLIIGNGFDLDLGLNMRYNIVVTHINGLPVTLGTLVCHRL